LVLQVPHEHNGVIGARPIKSPGSVGLNLTLWALLPKLVLLKLFHSSTIILKESARAKAKDEIQYILYIEDVPMDTTRG